MVWKDIADILEVGELTQRLQTHTLRLIHKFSLATGISNPSTSIDFLLKVEIEKLDCVLSKRATRPYIYGHTSANAYVLIYV